jgi:hypothetical protein
MQFSMCTLQGCCSRHYPSRCFSCASCCCPFFISPWCNSIALWPFAAYSAPCPHVGQHQGGQHSTHVCVVMLICVPALSCAHAGAPVPDEQAGANPSCSILAAGEQGRGISTLSTSAQAETAGQTLLKESEHLWCVQAQPKHAPCMADPLECPCLCARHRHQCLGLTKSFPRRLHSLTPAVFLHCMYPQVLGQILLEVASTNGAGACTQV